MTRETKIGLLVGLAFIIIVGILLSEPLSRSSEVSPAPLPGVGSNVRSAVATPGANTAPPISMQQTQVAQQAPISVAPQQTVPTQQEVVRPRGGIGVVIGPGATNPPGTNNVQAESRHDVIAANTQQQQQVPVTAPQPRTTLVGPRVGEVSIGTGMDPVGSQPEPAQPRVVSREPAKPTVVPPARTQPQEDGVSGIEATDPRLNAAKAGGEELEPFGKPRVAKGLEANPKPSAGKNKGSQEYEVQPGDSLGKIAAKFYGSSAKQYQDAIVNANPSLQKDRNKILVGVAYVIPAVEAQPAAPAAPEKPAVAEKPQVTQTTAQSRQKEPPVTPAAATEKPSASEHWYTVKERDTLWAIAKDQVGDAQAVAAIKELNRDTLKGGETVRVGMKLKLPAKPVASAN